MHYLSGDFVFYSELLNTRCKPFMHRIWRKAYFNLATQWWWGVKMEVGSADGLLCSSLRLQEHKPLRLGAAAAHFSLAKENMTNSFQLSGT